MGCGTGPYVWQRERGFRFQVINGAAQQGYMGCLLSVKYCGVPRRNRGIKENTLKQQAGKNKYVSKLLMRIIVRDGLN